jgi:hypothetical protein
MDDILLCYYNLIVITQSNLTISCYKNGISFYNISQRISISKVKISQKCYTVQKGRLLLLNFLKKSFPYKTLYVVSEVYKYLLTWREVV